MECCVAAHRQELWPSENLEKKWVIKKSLLKPLTDPGGPDKDTAGYQEARERRQDYVESIHFPAVLVWSGVTPWTLALTPANPLYPICLKWMFLDSGRNPQSPREYANSTQEDPRHGCQTHTPSHSECTHYLESWNLKRRGTPYHCFWHIVTSTISVCGKTLSWCSQILWYSKFFANYFENITLNIAS